MKHTIEPIANYHCNTGENPLWDETTGQAYWNDIPNGRIFRYDESTQQHEKIYEGEEVGGFTFQADGSLLLFQANKISRLAKDGTETVLVSGIDSDMARFNDIIADPEGRVYAGTIGANETSGGLYRVDLDGTVTNLFKGTFCANGMAFTPDRKGFYFTDTSAMQIVGFDYDQATGGLTNRRVVHQAPDDTGKPDGMTVDTDGNLWSARWDGFAVLKLSPDGEIIETIKFPVGKVSSICFGGPELRHLYATTAGGADDSDTADGTLYRVAVDAQGFTEFRSRILC